MIAFVRLLRRRTRQSRLVEAKLTIFADVAHANAITYIPKEITNLADQIARSQNCKVTLSKETSGYHLYLPCPDCLHTHGKDELKDPKYAINLSKYFGIGDDYRHLQEQSSTTFSPLTNDYNAATSDERNHKTGVCMRTWQSNAPHRYPVDVLIAMDTITSRHPEIHTTYRIVNGADGAERESHWEIDPISGEKCPPPPGTLTPILDLHPFHPARWYLETYRKFDLQRLTEMFRCGFCTQEYKEGLHNIWYRKFPGGWKDTPQGRIIFHSLHNGVPITWQGHYPERITEDGLNKYGLHPYTFEWSHLATRATAAQAWIPMPPFDELDDEGRLKFDPSKYKTAKHSGRELMGWDAAIQRADQDPEPIRWCVLTEGPLDCARVGPGGLCIMGKSLSQDNAAKVASNFHLVLTAFDNDRYGREATEKISASLHGTKCRDPIIAFVGAMEIPEGKDLGEMDGAGRARRVLSSLISGKLTLLRRRFWKVKAVAVPRLCFVLAKVAFVRVFGLSVDAVNLTISRLK